MDSKSKLLLLLVCWMTSLLVVTRAAAVQDSGDRRTGQGPSIMRRSGAAATQSRLQVLKRMVKQKQTQRDIKQREMTQKEMPQPAQEEDLDWLELLTSPQALDEFVQMLHLLQIPLDSVIPELPAVVQSDLQHKQRQEEEQAGDDELKGVFRLDKYHTLTEITTWMNELQQTHPNIMEILDIGKSYERRPLYVAKFSSADEKTGVTKPAIWMDAGIHSNEWIGPATMLFFMQQLVSGSEVAEKMLEDYDWYIMPVFNVDGYDYTWNVDRLWRKSRSEPVPESGCKGVDLNRNWAPPSARAEDTNPCSRTFPGKQPLSEPETLAVARFLEQHNSSVVAYLAYHAFSQMWMTPYAYTASNQPTNYQQLVSMAEEITHAIREVHGTQYKVGTVAKLIGETAGSSVDFTYDKLGIRYSFGIELRDAGRYGTLLPSDQILPNCEESWAGLVKMAELLPKTPANQKRVPPTL